MKILIPSLVLVLAVNQYSEAAPVVSGNSRDVQQSILPVDTRCSLSLGSNVIDYGVQSRWQLEDASTGGNNVTFGKRTLMLSVACPYTQSMRLTLRGDRAANGNLSYGSKGNMLVRLFDAQVDGQSAEVISTTSDGIINGAATDSRFIQPGQTFAAGTNGRLIKGKTFTARLEIEPMLPESEARVSARQRSEATLKLELMN